MPKIKCTYSTLFLEEIFMESYLLKSHSNSNDYMTLLEEVNDGYIVRIVRDKDGYEEVITDFISKMLFDSCVRTGYITKIENTTLNAITA